MKKWPNKKTLVGNIICCKFGYPKAYKSGRTLTSLQHPELIVGARKAPPLNNELQHGNCCFNRINGLFDPADTFFILSLEPGHTLDFFSNVIQRKTKQMSSDILLEGKPLSFFDIFCSTTAKNDLGCRELKQV